MKKFRIKKAAGAVVLILALMVSFLGFIPKENVYAASKTITAGVEGNDYTYAFDGDSPIYCIYYNAYTDMFYAISQSNFSVSIKVKNSDGVMTESSGKATSSSCSHYRYYVYNIGSAEYFHTQADYSIILTKLYNDPDFSKLGENIQSHFEGSLVNDENFRNDISNKDYVKDNSSTPDKSIGVLKNLSRNTLFPNGKANTDSVYWRFKYDSKSTMGYNLKTDGTKIRVYESLTYYKRSDDSVYSEGPKILIGNYDAVNLYFDFDTMSAFNKTTERTPDSYVCSNWDVTSKQLTRNDRLYFQIVSSSGKVGNFLMLGGQSDNGSANPQTTVDENGNVVSNEDGGYNSDDTSEHIGSSDDGDLDSADDDAESNPDVSLNNQTDSSISGATSTMKSMLEMVGNIPKIIGKLFSFLPDWCLAMIALSFAALVILIIYKLVRG